MECINKIDKLYIVKIEHNNKHFDVLTINTLYNKLVGFSVIGADPLVNNEILKEFNAKIDKKTYTYALKEFLKLKTIIKGIGL